jgi:hypothetical protein
MGQEGRHAFSAAHWSVWFTVTRVAFLFHPELGPFHLHWLNSVEAGVRARMIATRLSD